MLRVITFLVILLGGYGILRWAVRAWKRSDVTEKLDEIEENDELNAKISAIDMDDAEETREQIQRLREFGREESDEPPSADQD